jgi:hypothetical protein
VPPIILGGLGVIALVTFLYPLCRSYLSPFQRFPKILERILKITVTIFSLKKIAILLTLYYILYPLFLTLGQYYIWQSNEFTKLLLEQPLSRDVAVIFLFKPLRFLFDTELGYFVHYALGRFWLGSLITIVSSYILFGVLRLVQKYRGGFTSDEIIFYLIAALIVQWPQVLIFTVLALVFAVVHSIINTVRKIEETSLAPALVLAFIATYFFGLMPIDILNLRVLLI